MGFKLLKMYITKRSKRSKSVGRMFLAHTTHPPPHQVHTRKLKLGRNTFSFWLLIILKAQSTHLHNPLVGDDSDYLIC